MDILPFPDFNNTLPPMTCGFDNAGEDKFCCSEKDESDSAKKFPVQPPKYPVMVISTQTGPRDCKDETENCPKWVEKVPKSCSPGHDSYDMMRQFCQKSCDRCKANVSNP